MEAPVTPSSNGKSAGLFYDREFRDDRGMLIGRSKWNNVVWNADRAFKVE